jgi:predicted esterase YcpF (UPF0227 family)
MTTTHLLYLHGFRSSPQSAKAQQMAAYVQSQHPDVTLWCPQLPPSPRAAMALVAQGIANWPRARMAVLGSSLGGFYASWVAQLCACPSVLINPAVSPARDLARHIGEQTSWHDPAERFFFSPDYIDELQALDTRALPPTAPEMALIAKGDEVLDWREMTARYPRAQTSLIEGGEHALLDFANYLPQIGQFLNLA